ncbi:MAG: type II secretion system protein M [Proteobacteria bacterium]|nr:type II secretion system protein M [Pseudomonadota bacterium]MCP4916482.1 type II secretion system protein M [Pseudomonadota bacterium]
MSAIRRRIEGVTARFDAVLDGMSARDRKLLIGLAGFALLALMGGGFSLISGSLDAMELELDQRRQDLAYVEALKGDYADSSAQLADIETELQKHQDTSLSAFMEQAASKAGIRERLDSVRENSVVELGALVQKNHTVSLSKISLEQALDFLYEIEGTGYPLRVSNANFKVVKVKGEKLLNLRLEVAAYSLLQTEEG